MPTAQPDAAVVTLLADGELGLTSGTNLFTGPVRPRGTGMPDGPAVFCLASGGPLSQPYLGTGITEREKTVQVRVRSAPRKYSLGQTLARGCRDALHAATVAGYIFCLVREPEPVFLFQDPSDDTYHWSLNVRLAIDE